MENLSLWLAVAATWALILASYLFPSLFTPLLVFLLVTVVVFYIAARWAISRSAGQPKKRPKKT
jgi:membrane protein implicated in regulation of membrane protease activity